MIMSEIFKKSLERVGSTFSTVKKKEEEEKEVMKICRRSNPK